MDLDEGLQSPERTETRPIEKYWAIMKSALWKHPKEVKSEEEMKKKLISTQKNVGPNVVQDLIVVY